MTTYQDPPLQSRRAARQGERAEQAPAVFPLSTASPTAQPAAPEPLTYATRNRPALPLYDAAAQRGRRAAGQPQPEPAQEAAPQPLAPQPPAPQPPVSQPPVSQPELPSFRPRDFSPAAQPAPQSWESMGDQAAGNLEYHTQARPAPAPAPAAVVPEAEAPEYTLTRRELRALRDANGVAAVDAPAAPAPTSAPVAPALQPVAPAPQPVAPQPQDGLSAFDALFQPPAAAAPAPSAAAQLSAPPAPEPLVPAPVPAPAPVAQVAAPAPAPAPAPVVPATTPAGHWSNQAALDDAEQVNESTISRSVGVGSAAITTSALVLPGIPNREFAKLGTGEVLVTGSIDLPRSLSTAGAHPTQLDEHDLDHLLDPGDQQVASTDSAPVRAVQAISTHTSTRNVMVQARKPRGTRALTVLIVSAAAMAAVVVTLLVVGLVSGIL